MSTIAGLLSIARSAIIAEQAAVQTVGQNIANAETPGYSRQQVVMNPLPPERTGMGILGTGVTISNVLRTREVLLDQAFRTQNAPADGAKTRGGLLGSIEGIFGEPSTSGLASTLDAFWNAWSDLASNPTSATAKTVVQQRGAAVVSTFNRYATQLDSLSTSTVAGIPDTLAAANRLTSQIAAINGQIVGAESGGMSANDLRDQRDLLIDQLSKIVPVTVIDRANGSDQVNIGGIPIVDGADFKALTLTVGPPMAVTVAGSNTTLRNLGGSLGATLDVVSKDIPAARAALDTMAAALVTDVNAIHTTGWSPPAGATGNWNGAVPPTGGSGILFFDGAPANANAATIRLSAEVTADANAIAAGNVLNGTGDNAVALAVSALRDFSPSAPTNSFSASYTALISGLAANKNAADDSTTVYATLVKQADQRRLSSSGVSTDEELISLMRHQQAYAAAGKLIQTIDLMAQTILDIRK